MYALADLKQSKAPPPQLAQFSFQTWHVKIDAHVASSGEEVSADDLFNPQFWVKCTKIRPGDLVRVERDGEYDFELCCKAVGPSGPLMGLPTQPGSPMWARLVAAQAAAREAEADGIAAHMLTPRGDRA